MFDFTINTDNDGNKIFGSNGKYAAWIPSNEREFSASVFIDSVSKYAMEAAKLDADLKPEKLASTNKELLKSWFRNTSKQFTNL